MLKPLGIESRTPGHMHEKHRWSLNHLLMTAGHHNHKDHRPRERYAVDDLGQSKRD